MGRLPLVLAIEPDLRQAAIVKRVVKERLQAEIVVVDSRDAAIAAIGTAMPDVLLVSALLSPRDEDDLMAHLRTLEGAAHLQTHTIPQLASALGPGESESRGGLFSFRRRKQYSAPAGCDPDLFADEIRMYVQRAEEKKREAAEGHAVPSIPTLARRTAAAPAAAPREEPAPAPSSSWESPFEWRPSQPSSFIPHPEPANTTAESLSALPGSVDAEPIEDAFPVPSAAIAAETGPQTVVVAGEKVARTGYRRPGTEDQESARRDFDPRLVAAWARNAPSITDLASAPSSDEFHQLFGKLGVPDAVASVSYAHGCRIRRVRVPVARENRGALHGAVIDLSRRVIAELRGTDVRT